MVLGRITHSQITCAHLWPRQTLGRGLEAFELSRLDVNNPRNFLRLHKSIELAFDRKRLTFLPVSVSIIGHLEMKVVILDPKLCNEDLSFNQTTVKFSTLHEHSLWGKPSIGQRLNNTRRRHVSVQSSRRDDPLVRIPTS
ncbi:hypothetical protein B484DRAFT_73894 [Ochromonadaceae sp. CCMP2298]|nr:hypothetical protein B484DRAFT_73894 [Ochromonadaceae sp. CCMP2298]